MADTNPDVKRTLDDKWRERCLEFVDGHPRVGWYIAVLSTANFVVSIIGLFH